MTSCKIIEFSRTICSQACAWPPFCELRSFFRPPPSVFPSCNARPVPYQSTTARPFPPPFLFLPNKFDISKNMIFCKKICGKRREIYIILLFKLDPRFFIYNRSRKSNNSKRKSSLDSHFYYSRKFYPECTASVFRLFSQMRN